MGRFANSWDIAKQSWSVLRANPALAAFPMISGIATVLVSLPFLAPMAFMFYKADSRGSSHDIAYYTALALSFLMYVATYTVIVFFNSALVSCANKNLQGQPATMAEGIQEAARHLPKIIGWALIAATVGQLLKMLQEQMGLIGRIIVGLIGVAWNLAIFFVVPIMVLENKGPVDALKASTERLKQTWGEQIILNGSLGLISFLFVGLPLIGMLVLAIILATGNLFVPAIAMVVLGVLYAIGGSCVLSSMSVIYQTALYLFVSRGLVAQGYSMDTIQGAFGPKRR